MNIPTTPKRFENWLEKQKADLPANVYLLGQDYHFCLNMIALNRGNAEALKAARRINAARMKEFMTAYAEHQAKQRAKRYGEN